MVASMLSHLDKLDDVYLSLTNMCILFLHYHPSSSGFSCTCPYVLVAADNRDEFFHRPTQPLAFWEHHSDILAGTLKLDW